MAETPHVPDPVVDRALGALVGLAVGDALGTTIEFSQRDACPPVTDMVGGGPFRLAPGEWTDDTSMALCLADSLIANLGELDHFDLAQRFVGWWQEGQNSVTGRCFDIGNATSAALASYIRTGDPVGDPDPWRAGNGGIMRQAPAVLAGWRDVERAVLLSREQSRVTHASAECLDAAEVLARILHAGIAGFGTAALHAASGLAVASPKVEAVATGGWEGKPRHAIRSTGYVVDTLEAALWAVGTSGGFGVAVVNAVNPGPGAGSARAGPGPVGGPARGWFAPPPVRRGG
ncbi:ADP-ribosylglycohydrolase family protein [Nostoc sp. NIES-2111]